MTKKQDNTSLDKKSLESINLADELFSRRIIQVDREITPDLCSEWIGRLIILDMAKVKKPIILLINSYGGDLHAALGLTDIMQKITSPIITACIGVAQSAASCILAAGNKRYAVPNSEIMIHQQWSYFEESMKHDELINEVEASKKSFKKLVEFYTSHTKMNKSQVEKNLKKDTYFNAQECLEYGIIDEINWDIQTWMK
jgi:ATP-dependent Clp protease protease subunit